MHQKFPINYQEQTDYMTGSMNSPAYASQAIGASDDVAFDDFQIKNIVSAAAESTEEQVNRLARIKIARNPLLEAAKPLLLTLAQMPKTLDQATEVPVFRQLLEREVIGFQSLCGKADIKRAHVTTASYCLCTALDEAANSTHWGGSQHAGEVGAWSSQMLASTFHGDVDGGKKFFLLIGRLATQPEEHIDLLELMYHILCLGFEGQYSTDPNGRRQLETIRHRLLTMLTASREAVPRELSAHWQGQGVGKFKLLRSIPVWTTASLLALLLFGLFAWYKYQLMVQGNAVEADIVAIGKMTPPAVPLAASLKLAQLLKDEIARGQVTVDEDASHSGVTFKGDDMFIPGQATVNAKILPLLNKVAGEIAKVTGTVQVIGHSDNRPIKTRQFPDNQTLSQERAARVADVLQAGGVTANRVEIIGRGDSQPLTGNATAADRAKNRRVEIIVSQGRNGATAAVSPAAAPPASTSSTHSSAASAVAAIPAR
ncbi:type VI secretion system protein TssL, long form [Collimonas silvisoli]|uniref:type VI secretion system protein TssL, long form n=1 Tax=Collimonas silvisoli TaxID=2825884 RepID=UPI001E4EE09D|nr:type VI secretion system protein TssL, long form [Collimonas silvisoli]